MSKQITIAVAESSDVIRVGIVAILKRMSGIQAEILEINDNKALKQNLAHQHVDVLIVNPLLTGFASLATLRNELQKPHVKFIALQTILVKKSDFQDYDDVISIHDSSDQIKEKLHKIIATPESNKPSEALSVREKEILSLMVKGLSNKQIAELLFISVHTVVTHRRNIGNKLDIHSTSGLTIYAIVNGLIEINDVG